ncbi:hypothetical protein G6O67_005606 [Ophiocordyceps sinensis]|uniref:PCA1 HMA heavy metal-associated domain-containing protein n=2 Tax=Ophiocordyceps sinensis TaxID=72228 RepID=A0A8H4PN93_9HYPO|nr:copper transporting P-type ATPase protein [Ophiocordyceps sinensis CO18]KAF4506921.1 hypothetical protein G6O67_005606 [Ophiocordyceps sinensis]
MTCTGCETKLNRTLATMASIGNLKTSLVLSRVELDVDLSLTTVESVMTPGENDRVHGTVRIAFDDKLLGARDLMEKDWGAPVRLAPIRGDPGLEAGNKHVRHVGYMSLLSAALIVPVLVLAWAPLPERELAYSCASFALATIVQVAIAGPFYPKALKALVFSRVIEMGLLIVVSTSAAYIFSVVSFIWSHWVAVGKALGKVRVRGDGGRNHLLSLQVASLRSKESSSSLRAIEVAHRTSHVVFDK